ncbi:MAG: NACHT domain-containing protein, partial [Cyanobacteriota bacterium]|nr:NACHT domain-containing protein [Cyanobacteriota bacterium]
RGYRLTQEGVNRVREMYKAKGLTQEKLATLAHTTVDTVKRLLGTKRSENGVERWVIENVVRVLGLKPTDIVDPKIWNPHHTQYPSEFKSLIEEKISNFCGRQFVFDAFEQFLNSHLNGYFTLIGDAGMGKSAIASKYVADCGAICYFNVLAERRNRPELFLKSVRQQIIQRYQLKEAEQDNLSTLLAKVSEQLKTGDRLVIVVDALDEVEQEPGGNLLDLPKTLPKQVYFFLTRRPYILRNKRLFIDPGVPIRELDLTHQDYCQFSQQDIQEYIRLFVAADSDYQNTLRQWIQNQNVSIEQFIQQVAEKSENNFMYIRYLLPAIANGNYNDLDLKDLPQGLQEYYQTHWVRMGMEERQPLMVMVLFILVEIGTPIPCGMIAEISDTDEADVGEILERWREYLIVQEIESETCWTLYHASFLQFLSQKRDLKSSRKLFKEVNQRIVDYYQSFAL